MYSDPLGVHQQEVHQKEYGVSIKKNMGVYQMGDPLGVHQKEYGVHQQVLFARKGEFVEWNGQKRLWSALPAHRGPYNP